MGTVCGAPRTSQTPEKTEAQKQFNEFDTNHDGKLDFDEFKALAIEVLNFAEEEEDDIRAMFERTDADNSGFVDLLEFKTLNFLQTATSMRGATMRKIRLENIIPEETELVKQFEKYGLIEEQHGDEHEYTIIVFSWYTGAAEEILTYYEPFFSQLKNTRVVAVNGPFKDITIRPNNPGHRWYDYFSDLPTTTGNPNVEDAINQEELSQSRKDMLELLDIEIERLGDSTKVFFTACSQGGFMALDVAMNSAAELGGVVGNCTALGSYSPINTTCTGTPIIQYHGDKDQVIGLELCKKGAERMKQAGFEHKLIIEKEKTHYTDQQGEVDNLIEVFGQWMVNGKTEDLEKPSGTFE